MANYFSLYPYSKKALVVVPVANAIGEPFEHLSSSSQYNKIPASWGPHKTDKVVCPRLHQLLFNEIVTIIKEQTDGQVLIQLPTMFYLDSETHDKRTMCWTLKKYLLPLDQLGNAHFITSHVPKPISSQKNELSSFQLTVTLKLPFFDPLTRRTFSAGTRFIAKSESHESYRVYMYTPSEHNFKKIELPKKYCAATTYKNHSEQIAAFVDLLTLWAHLPNGAIPFVWGGVSFAQIYKRIQFSLKEKKGDNRGFFWFLENEEYPLSGFDCSGLILRAAQICQIPYFFKNTLTAKNSMSPITSIDDLKRGDLLWVPGALFAVSNLARNKVISVLGYQYGYGSVFEKKLNELFVGIETFEQLFDAQHNNQLIKLKNNDGTIARTINQSLFLSMHEIFCMAHHRS